MASSPPSSSSLPPLRGAQIQVVAGARESSAVPSPSSSVRVAVCLAGHDRLLWLHGGGLDRDADAGDAVAGSGVNGHRPAVHAEPLEIVGIDPSRLALGGLRGGGGRLGIEPRGETGDRLREQQLAARPQLLLLGPDVIEKKLPDLRVGLLLQRADDAYRPQQGLADLGGRALLTGRRRRGRDREGANCGCHAVINRGAAGTQYPLRRRLASCACRRLPHRLRALGPLWLRWERESCADRSQCLAPRALEPVRSLADAAPAITIARHQLQRRLGLLRCLS